jgi:Family of unknown function (DUF5681)
MGATQSIKRCPNGVEAVVEREVKQAISEPEQGSHRERLPGSSGRNGLVPPIEHRFVPGQSGNPNGRPRQSVTAKQLRKMARQLTPCAVQRLVELLTSGDDKVALSASLALLERGYGKAASEVEVEESIRAEAARSRRSVEEMTVEKARQLMEVRT